MILVTGSTGLTGSHLLYELLSRGKRVKALVREGSNKEKVRHIFSYYTTEPDSLFQQIEWVTGDVTDMFSLSEAFEGITHVYHTAAYVSFSQTNKKQIFETNVGGTANIVNLCIEKGIEKLCFTSSIAALGSSESGAPVNEDDLWKPVKKSSAYSLSKFKAEMEVWRGITEGLNAVIVNPSVILGPGFWATSSGKLFQSVANGLQFYTKGSTGFVDVRDVARAMVDLMDSDIAAERFVLSSQNRGYYDLFVLIANELGIKAPEIYASPVLTDLAWRVDAVKSTLLRIEPTITQDSANISHKALAYSSDKIAQKLNFKFLSVDETTQC